MEDGLQYIRKNEIKGCKCRMDEPFMFISYSHDDRDIVQPWFLELYRQGYNLWIDTANLPHNQKSWEYAAEDALISENCVRLLFFRSENSMKSVNIYEELGKADGMSPPLDITAIDIWREPSINASNYMSSFIPRIKAADEQTRDALRQSREIARKIFKIVSEEANAIQDGLPGLLELFRDEGFLPVLPAEPQTQAAPAAAPGPAKAAPAEQAQAADTQAPAPVKRGRGRPPGSKNKVKAPPAEVPAPSPAPAADKDVSLSAVFQKVLTEFPQIKAQNESIKGHPMYFFFQDEVPEILYRTGLADRQLYHVAGSAGKGMWSAVPWIGIFDRRITTSAQRGVYIVYLFSADGQSLYLTLNQGCSELVKEYGGKTATRMMRENTAQVRSALDARGFSSDDEAILGEHLPPLAQGYQNGIIFYRRYDKAALPPEAQLRQDLASMLQVYRDYAARFLP